MAEQSFDSSFEQSVETTSKELPTPRLYPSLAGYMEQRFSNLQPSIETPKILQSLSIIGYDSFLPAGGSSVAIEGFTYEGRNIAIITSTPQNGDPRTVNIIEIGNSTDFIKRRGQGEIAVLGVILENREGQCTDLLDLLPEKTQVTYRTDKFVARTINQEERLSLDHHPRRKIVVPPIATNRASLPARIFNDFVARNLDTFKSGTKYWDIDKLALLHEISHDLLNNVGMQRISDQLENAEVATSTVDVEIATKEYTTRLFGMFKKLGFDITKNLTDEQVEAIQQEFIATYEHEDQGYAAEMREMLVDQQ